VEDWSLDLFLFGLLVVRLADVKSAVTDVPRRHTQKLKLKGLNAQ
jgi:hypothetical protein